MARADVDGLAETRRALRALSKDAGREFDRGARKLAGRVRDRAADNTPKLTGNSARRIAVSSTYRGITVRSRTPYYGQIEFGRRVWLRRGLPYRSANGRGPGAAQGKHGLIPLRQVSLGGGMVVNEGQYLIRRQKPINNAATLFAPALAVETERMLDRLASKYRL